MQTTAAVVRFAGGPFQFETVELATPAPDEILVEVKAAGICHTDLSVRDQFIPVPLPAVLGHEGAGVVVEIGSAVRGLSPGDHVVMSQAFCGSCARCTAGDPAYCPDAMSRSLAGVRADGSHTLHDADGRPVSGCFVGQSSFAHHALARAVNTVKVPKEFPFALAAPLGCGVQTGAGAVLNELRPAAGSSIAVFGAGTVGLTAVMAARAVGCGPIIAVDVNAARLELAQEVGATHAVPAGSDAVAAIADITGGGADFSVEASGAPTAGTQAVACLQPRGTCALVGAAPYGTVLALDWITMMQGRSVRGVVMGSSDPSVFVPALVRMHAEGQLPLHRIVRTVPFEKINDAIEGMESGEVIKPVLLF